MSWRVESWRTIAGLEHGFGGRLDPPPDGVRTLRQVHGRRVIDAAELAAETDRRPDGDGLAVGTAGTLVGVWTADCAPLLLAAPAARAAAAVHCGWRGAASGIVPAALDLLQARWHAAPSDVAAALGPAIGGCCYEVGEEVRDAFVSRAGGGLGRVGFEERDARLFLDLRSFVAAELRALGVPSIERVGPCTACRTDVLHSYRRSRDGGRQLSYVGWR